MSKEELELGVVGIMPREGELRMHEATENESVIQVDKPPTNIVFTLNNGCDEALRIEADGSFYVRGKKVIKDIEVYNGFVDFLKGVGCYGKG